MIVGLSEEHATMGPKFLGMLLPILVAATDDALAQPTVEWQQLLGGTYGDWAGSVQETADLGYIVAGWTFSNDGDVSGNHGGYDAWVVKLDSSGIMQWQKALGGTGEDRATCMQQSADGGYVLAGYTSSSNGDVMGNHGGKDAWVVKLDGLGVIQWQQVLGGSGEDRASAIHRTMDGGYCIVGGTASNDGDVSGNHGGEDVWVVKLDSVGTLQWQRTLGGTGDERAASVEPTSDGGYVLGGYTLSNNGDVTLNHGAEDAWVIKLDSTGNIQWQKTMGGTGSDRANAVQRTEDGGYILAGTTTSDDGGVIGYHGSGDAWLARLDDTGAILWQRALGGMDGDGANAIVQTGDGGYIMAGHASSIDGNVGGNHGSDDLWLVKVNSSGVIQWQRASGGTNADEASSIRPTSDGGYVVAGSAGSNDGDVSGNHGYVDVWVIKLAMEGVGIHEWYSPSMDLHPNPTTGSVSLMWSEARVASSITVLDVSGRTLETVPPIGNGQMLDLGGYASGLYLVKVLFVDGTEAEGRVLKE